MIYYHETEKHYVLHELRTQVSNIIYTNCRLQSVKHTGNSLSFRFVEAVFLDDKLPD